MDGMDGVTKWRGTNLIWRIVLIDMMLSGKMPHFPTSEMHLRVEFDAVSLSRRPQKAAIV